MEEPDEKPPIIQNSHSSGESKSLPLIKLQCTMHASLNQIENFISVIIQRDPIHFRDSCPLHYNSNLASAIATASTFKAQNYEILEVTLKKN
mgnify:CR=1 FL=1